MPIDVSIIIVNYKSEQDLEKCLKSLYRCTEGVSFEIFIYNNDSNKDTLEALISSYNNCNLIQSFSNVGFAKACNLAASKASGKYLFFLNPDTYLENNALGYFIDFFENNSNNKTACLGAYMNRKKLIEVLSEETSFSKKDITKVLDTFSRIIMRTLKRGSKVQLSGFGTYSVAKRAARKGINPATKESIHLPAIFVVRFRAGKVFKKTVRSIAMDKKTDSGDVNVSSKKMEI